MSGRYFSLMVWSLFFFDGVVIFSHFKVSRVDFELEPFAAFPHAAVTAGDSQAYPSISLYLVGILKKIGTNPIRRDRGFYLWAFDYL